MAAHVRGASLAFTRTRQERVRARPAQRANTMQWTEVLFVLFVTTARRVSTWPRREPLPATTAHRETSQWAQQTAPTVPLQTAPAVPTVPTAALQRNSVR